MKRLQIVIAAFAAVLTIGVVGTAHADLSEKLRPDGKSRYTWLDTQECQLPALGESIEALSIDGRTPRRLDMPPLYVMVVLGLIVKSYDKGEVQFDVKRLPLLPDGGVDEVDLCGPLETQRLRVPAVGKMIGSSALRMRPSLDLATAYPAFGEDFAQSKRVVRTKPKSFAAFSAFTSDEKILREAFAEHPLVQSESSLWTMPGLILVPLKP